MKIKLSILACLALTSIGYGATISGNFARDFFTSTLADPGVATGGLVIAVVDTGDDGFGGDVNLNTAQSVAVDGFFGGDLIIGQAAVTLAGAIPNQFSTVSFNINKALSALNALGKRYAMIWLPSLTVGATSAGAGTTFGFATHNTWITPAVEGGSITYGVNPGNARSIIMDSTNAAYTAPSGSVIDGAAPSPAGFFYTNAVSGAGRTQGYAGLAIVPEPSTAAFGMLAAFGLFARRRRA